MFDIVQKMFGERIASKPKVKTVPAEVAENMTDDCFSRGQFYFDIRLCELYLRNVAEGGRRFVPRAISIIECKYDQPEPSMLPKVVGADLLSKLSTMTGTDNETAHITMRNCLLAGPMPYRGGDIGLFSGLYRVEVGNVIDSAIDLVADITSSLGLNLTKYTDIASQISNRLPSILGQDSSCWRILHYEPIFKPGDEFFDRYLVLIGDDGEEFDTGKLAVRKENERELLYIGDGDGSVPFTSRDYLLLKLRSSPERNDHESFEYQKRFNVVKQHLVKGELAQAEWAHLELNQEITNSPDLTEDDRWTQIAIIKKAVAKIKENLGLVEKYEEVKHKGGVDAVGDEVINGALESKALNKPEWFSRGLVKSLKNLRESWDELDEIMQPELAGLLDPEIESVISSETINRFSKKMATIRVDDSSAAELSDVIKVNTLSL